MWFLHYTVITSKFLLASSNRINYNFILGLSSTLCGVGIRFRSKLGINIFSVTQKKNQNNYKHNNKN